jgi:integrase
VPPKTDASIATLDLPDFVAETLLVHRDREKLRRHYAEDGYVFTSTTGTPLEPDNITHRFPEFLAEHHMRHLRLHDLRHSAASLLLAKGVPLWMVSKILRHSGISTTADTYGHLLKETSRDAADVMSNLLGGPSRWMPT